MRWSLLFLLGLLACSSWSRKGHTGTNEEAILELIRRGEPIHLSDVHIKEDVNLDKIDGMSLDGTIRRISIDVPLVFDSCTFEGVFKAENAGTVVHFNQPVIFRNCRFQDSVLLRGAVFHQEIIVQQCTVQQTFDAGATIFKSLARFGENEFEGNVQFQSAIFEQKASFFKSGFRAISNFQSAQFRDKADFGATSFNSYAEFSQIHFNGGAFFSYLNAQDRLILNHCLFRDRADFIKMEMKGSIEFRGNIFFLEPRIQWPEGEYKLLEEDNTVMKSQPLIIQ